MVASSSMSTEIEGTVERVGSYGFTLAGREGWVSLSKFASPRPELPRIGDRVAVAMDKAGYARDVRVLELPQSAPRPVLRAVETTSEPVDRDTRIMRQAVLNTATAILASGGQVADVGMVIDLAETLEQWVTR